MNANDIIEKCAGIAEADGEECMNRANESAGVDDQKRSIWTTCAMTGTQIARAIRALKSSLPAETANEAMVERALRAYYPQAAEKKLSEDAYRKMRAALEAAALAPVDDGWRPIESAPKDGTTILVSFGTRGVHAVAWCEPSGFDHEIWCVDDGKHGPYALRGWSEKPRPTAPTHWRPLPAPPKDGR